MATPQSEPVDPVLSARKEALSASLPEIAEVYKKRFARVKQSILDYYIQADKGRGTLALLEKAFSDAEYHHRHQTRKSGEPYILHPARVALMAAEAGLDQQTAIIALLHDLIEDTEITKEELRVTYGDWLVEVVEGLTKVTSKDRTAGGAAMATYRKLIYSTVKDLRTLEVKILDRLDNMRDLGFLSRRRQREISQETVTVYAPMAQRLGMQDIGDELIALGFRYMYPKRFKMRLEALKELIRKEQSHAAGLTAMLETVLKDLRRSGVRVEPRFRRISDLIYERKTLDKALVGIKVVVSKSGDCYRAMGAVHIRYRVVPNSIKDFISNPKPNRYQALHSEVFMGREPVSIQIVSQTMEQVNSQGVLARRQGSNEELVRYYQSYLDLLDHYSGDNNELRMEDVLRYGQMETLQTFTPKGDPYSFASGSSVLDFAFSIHTDLGLHCDGAIIGGRRVGRFQELHDGEVVQVLTHKAVQPNPAWLDNVRTTRAKLAIRRFLNTQAHQRAHEVGRRLFGAELARLGLGLEVLEARGDFLAALQSEGWSMAQFYQQVGQHKIQVRNFLLERNLLNAEEQARLAGRDEPTLLQRLKITRARARDPVLTIKGTEEAFIRLASCCSPLEGDDIFGVQDARGMTIHRAECVLLHKVPLEDRIRVDWEKDERLRERRLSISLSQDQPGLLYKVSKVMRDLRVNILDIGLNRDVRTGQSDIRMLTEEVSPKTFRTVVARLRDIKEVKKITALLATPGRQ